MKPRLIDPDEVFLIKELYWPWVQFYDKQVEMIESTFTNVETYVTAGNKLGKDFVTAFIVLSAFMICTAREWTCRIVTTSVKEKHLKVLWGEIGRFIATSARPLTVDKGGMLVVNFQEMRKVDESQAKNPLSYAVGQVAEGEMEGLAGHHAQFTLAVGDESSGLSDKAYDKFQGWAKHMLFFGNPNACENFWKKNIEAGDLYSGSYTHEDAR